MHLIVAGATGLVGSGVLDAMIRMTDVTKISVLSRRPVPMVDDAKDPRITVIIHKDFEKYTDDVLNQLKGASGCVWALGISQAKVGKEEYVTITKTYALEAAKAFATLPTDNEPFRFIYVSGQGATQTPGMLSPYFAGIKGETERLLSEMREKNPRLLAESVRPAMVDPSQHDAIKNYMPNQGAAVNMLGSIMFPATRALKPSIMSPTGPLGKFLVEMAMGRHDASLEEGSKRPVGVQTLAPGGLRIVENVAFRKMAGLPC